MTDISKFTCKIPAGDYLFNNRMFDI